MIQKLINKIMEMKQLILSITNFRSMAVIFVLIIFAGCNGMIDGVSGNGNVVAENREVSGFSEIDAGGMFKIILEQSNQESLKIETDENLMPLIRTKVLNNVLKISSDRPIRNSKNLNIYITFRDIHKISVSGACSVISRDDLKLDELTIDGSGATEIDIRLISQRFDADLSGANEVRLSGETGVFELELSGASKIRAFDFIAQEVRIEASGAADANVYAEKHLNARASGAASIKYMGNPSIDQHISGAGSIRKR
jgi:hypothetical protein